MSSKAISNYPMYGAYPCQKVKRLGGYIATYSSGCPKGS